MMILAERLGSPIDPDELWLRFSSDFGTDARAPAATAASTLLDIARAFGIARHMDVTHDVDRVAQSLKCANVSGVLLSWERYPTQPGGSGFAAHHHVVAVSTVVHTDQSHYIEALSPQTGQAPEPIQPPVSILDRMMAHFEVFYR
jgi:hypothetical protein